MNKPDRAREVNQEVSIVHILDGDAELADARRGVVGRNGFASDRHYMCDPALREDARRFGSLDPIPQITDISKTRRMNGNKSAIICANTHR